MNIQICNVNLLKINAKNQVTNGITATFNLEEQSITFNGTCTANNTVITICNDSIKMIPGMYTAYVKYISGSVVGNEYSQLQMFDSQYTESVICAVANEDKKRTYNKTAEKALSVIGIRFDKDTVLDNYKIKVLFGRGDIANYQESKQQNILVSLDSQEELRKAVSYKNVTNIICRDEIECNFDVEYYQDLRVLLNNKIANTNEEVQA